MIRLERLWWVTDHQHGNCTITLRLSLNHFILLIQHRNYFHFVTQSFFCPNNYKQTNNNQLTVWKTLLKAFGLQVLSAMFRKKIYKYCKAFFFFFCNFLQLHSAETPNGWNIEFQNGGSAELIIKTVPMGNACLFFSLCRWAAR